MNNPTPPLALIIGASRGLGLAMAAEYARRGWQVIATARGDNTELHRLAAGSTGRIEVEQVDIADAAQIAALGQRLQRRRFDLLFVNAGVANDPGERIGEVSTEEFSRILLTNTLGPMRVLEALAPQVTPGGAIGVMSSGLGSVADNESGGWEVYRASKAALNTLMRSFAVRAPGAGHSLLVIAPGWVRTDMGGPDATLGVDESIPGVVDTLTAYAGKPGVRYLDYRGRTVRW